MSYPVTTRAGADAQSAHDARAANAAEQLETIGQALALALTLSECLHLIAEPREAQAGEAEPRCVLDAQRLLGGTVA